MLLRGITQDGIGAAQRRLVYDPGQAVSVVPGDAAGEFNDGRTPSMPSSGPNWSKRRTAGPHGPEGATLIKRKTAGPRFLEGPAEGRTTIVRIDSHARQDDHTPGSPDGSKSSPLQRASRSGAGLAKTNWAAISAAAAMAAAAKIHTSAGTSGVDPEASTSQASALAGPQPSEAVHSGLTASLERAKAHQQLVIAQDPAQPSGTAKIRSSILSNLGATVFRQDSAAVHEPAAPSRPAAPQPPGPPTSRPAAPQPPGLPTAQRWNLLRHHALGLSAASTSSPIRQTRPIVEPNSPTSSSPPLQVQRTRLTTLAPLAIEKEEARKTRATIHAGRASPTSGDDDSPQTPGRAVSPDGSRSPRSPGLKLKRATMATTTFIADDGTSSKKVLNAFGRSVLSISTKEAIKKAEADALAWNEAVDLNDKLSVREALRVLLLAKCGSLDHAFKSLDYNNTKFITKSQLDVGLKVMNLEGPLAKLCPQKLFEMMEVRSSEGISLKDWRRFFGYNKADKSGKSTAVDDEYKGPKGAWLLSKIRAMVARARAEAALATNQRRSSTTAGCPHEGAGRTLPRIGTFLEQMSAETQTGDADAVFEAPRSVHQDVAFTSDQRAEELQLQESLEELGLSGVAALAYILKAKCGSMDEAFSWLDDRGKGYFTRVHWATANALLHIDLKKLTGLTEHEVILKMSEKEDQVNKAQWDRYFNQEISVAEKEKIAEQKPKEMVVTALKKFNDSLRMQDLALLAKKATSPSAGAVGAVPAGPADSPAAAGPASPVDTGAAVAAAAAAGPASPSERHTAATAASLPESFAADIDTRPAASDAERNTGRHLARGALRDATKSSRTGSKSSNGNRAGSEPSNAKKADDPTDNSETTGNEGILSRGALRDAAKSSRTGSEPSNGNRAGSESSNAKKAEAPTDNSETTGTKGDLKHEAAVPHHSVSEPADGRQNSRMAEDLDEVTEVLKDLQPDGSKEFMCTTQMERIKVEEKARELGYWTGSSGDSLLVLHKGKMTARIEQVVTALRTGEFHAFKDLKSAHRQFAIDIAGEKGLSVLTEDEATKGSGSGPLTLFNQNGNVDEFVEALRACLARMRVGQVQNFPALAPDRETLVHEVAKDIGLVSATLANGIISVGNLSDFMLAIDRELCEFQQEAKDQEPLAFGPERITSPLKQKVVQDLAAERELEARSVSGDEGLSVLVRKVVPSEKEQAAEVDDDDLDKASSLDLDLDMLPRLRGYMRKADLMEFLQQVQVSGPALSLAATFMEDVLDVFDDTLELQADMGSRVVLGIDPEYFQVFLTKVARTLGWPVMSLLLALREWYEKT